MVNPEDENKTPDDSKEILREAQPDTTSADTRELKEPESYELEDKYYGKLFGERSFDIDGNVVRDVVKAENGALVRESRFDAQKGETYEKSITFKDKDDPKEGDMEWGFEKTIQHSGDGKTEIENGSRLDKLHSWEEKRIKDDEDNVIEKEGRITVGDEKGKTWRSKIEKQKDGSEVETGKDANNHEWQVVKTEHSAKITFGGREWDVIIKKYKGRVLAQGDDPKAKPEGHEWTKWAAMDTNDLNHCVTYWNQSATPIEDGGVDYKSDGGEPESIKYL